MSRLKSLALDRTSWDLCGTNGNTLAVVSPPYSLAQQVANKCRRFKGANYYNQDAGIPYIEDFIGQMPPQALLESWYEQEALKVSGVIKARCIITSIDPKARTVSGEIQFIDEEGIANNATF